MLVSLSEIKTYLGITTTDDDAFLRSQLELISKTVEGYCGRKFELKEYIQTFYGDDFKGAVKELPMFHYPLVSITTIEENEVPVTEYRVQKPLGIIVRKDGLIHSGNSELVVQYVAGFECIPTPITSTVKSLVEERYNKYKSGISLNFGSDVQRVSIPGTISVDFDYSLDSNQRTNAYGTILGSYLNVLDPYRSERVIVGSGKLTYVEEVE